MTSNEKKYLNSELQKLKRAVKKVAQQEGDVVPNNSTMSLTKAVTQTTHGFIVGNTIRHNGTKWVKSQANNKANAKTVGVVYTVADANTFSYAFGGFVAGTYVNGTSYFLSPTTAGLVVTEPTYVDGQVREFIGTGTPDGLLLELDLGDVWGEDLYNGKSAYEVAVANGYVGIEVQWLASLQGANGATGATGSGLKMTVWSAGAYALGDQVNHLGKDWVAIASTVAADVPDASPKWVERLYFTTDILNDIDKVDFSNFLGTNCTWIEGKYLNANGVESVYSTYSYTSNYIPAVAGKKYKLPTIGISVIWYDVNSVFIASSGISTDVYKIRNVIAPANTAFMRVNQLTAFKNNMIITTVGTYNFNNIKISSLQISKDRPSSFYDITDFLKTNIVAKYSEIKWITGKYLEATGKEGNSASFSYSETFLRVKELQQYKMPTSSLSAIFYDINFNVVGSFNTSADVLPRTYTTPATTHYVRVNQLNTVKENFTLELIGTFNFNGLSVNKSQIIDDGGASESNALELSVQTIRDISASIDFTLYPIQGNVLVSGDSTIAAYAGGTAIADIIKATGTITNIAVAGHTIDQQKAAYIALAAGVKTALNYVFIQIGLNDLAPTETAFTAIAKIQSYVNNVKTNSPSAKIILGEMLPCKQRLTTLYGATNGVVSYQKWQKMNYLISEKGILNTDKAVNLHTFALSDGFGNLASIYNTGDAIHENTAGRKLIAYSWITSRF